MSLPAEQQAEHSGARCTAPPGGDMCSAGRHRCRSGPV